MPKLGRRACCVPFCRRTAPLDPEVTEIICGAHWRLADRGLTRRYKRWQRRTAQLMECDPETYSPSDRLRIVRMVRICDRLWCRIRHQSIDRAMGLS